MFSFKSLNIWIFLPCEDNCSWEVQCPCIHDELCAGGIPFPLLLHLLPVQLPWNTRPSPAILVFADREEGFDHRHKSIAGSPGARKVPLQLH